MGPKKASRRVKRVLKGGKASPQKQRANAGRHSDADGDRAGAPTKPVVHSTITGALHRGLFGDCKICNFFGGRAVCTCGHRGDCAPDAIPAGQHDGQIAHGACLMPGCSCPKFTWAGFVVEYAEALKAGVVRS